MQRHRNFGSTCYLNALMQAMTGLKHAPSFEKGEGGLSNTFFRYCRTCDGDLRQVAKTVAAAIGAGQQDAHDLWTLIADDVYKHDKHIFHGKTRVTVRCKSCGFSHNNDETFHSLSLKRDGRKSTPWDFTKGIHNLLRREVLEGYRCDKCSVVGRCVRTVQLSELPEVLVFHIARFECDLTGSPRKITDPFSYPYVQVDLCNLVKGGNGSSLYRLHAVIDHIGTLSGGHYVARRQNAEGAWHILDDDKKAWPAPFKPDASCPQLTTDSSAYMLVFQRLA